MSVEMMLHMMRKWRKLNWIKILWLASVSPDDDDDDKKLYKNSIQSNSILIMEPW